MVTLYSFSCIYSVCYGKNQSLQCSFSDLRTWIFSVGMNYFSITGEQFADLILCHFTFELSSPRRFLLKCVKVTRDCIVRRCFSFVALFKSLLQASWLLMENGLPLSINVAKQIIRASAMGLFDFLRAQTTRWRYKYLRDPEWAKDEISKGSMA